MIATWCSYTDLYNHFKVTPNHVRMIITLLLRTLPILVKKGTARVKKMTLSWKTSRARPIWLNVNVSVIIWLHILFPSFTVRLKSITSNHMLTSSYIFSGLIYLTFLSDIYGLMKHILCLIFIAPYCNVIAPLV